MENTTLWEIFCGLIIWLGSILIVGYALVSFNFTNADNLLYQLLNITGAAGIVYISVQKKTYQPAVLNMIWFVIGTAAILKILLFK